MLVVVQVNVPDEGVIAALGAVVLLLITACADAVHPFAGLVTVTVQEVVEVGETTLLFPVALIGAAHEYVIPEVGFAVSVTASPLQVIPSSSVVPDVSAKLIVGEGNGFTVTEVEVEAEQAVVEFVTVTV